MKAARYTVLTVISGLLSLASAAEDKTPEPKSAAYQGSVSEEQLRNDTRRVMGEIAALKEEFAIYPSVYAELGRLERAAKDLDQLEQNGMRDAARILRDASRLENADNTKAKISEAGAEQKRIQVRLREIADRLAVQKELAAMQHRFEDLALRQAANERGTRRAQEDAGKPDAAQKQQAVLNEQMAISKEIASAEESLRKLTQSGDEAKKKIFNEAVQKAAETQVRDKALKAVQKVAEETKEAATAQQAVMDGLKEVIAALDSNQSEEERAREMADKLEGLAKQQQDLANDTAKAQKQDQKAIQKQQEQISDRSELAKAALDKLSPEAAQHTGEAHQKAEEAVQKLDAPSDLSDANQAAQTTDRQQEAAWNLEKAGDLLKQKAEQLAQNSPHGAQDQNASGGQQEGQQNPVDSQQQQQQQKLEQEMTGLARQLQEAKVGMQLAERQIEQHSDLDDAAKRLGEAGEKLAQAEKMAAQLGQMLPAEVGQHIARAGEKAGEAKEGAHKGDGSEHDPARASLRQGREEIDRALAGLAAAAQMMPGQQPGQQSGQQQQANQGGKPQGENPNQGAAPGDLANTNPSDANLIRAGKAEVGQREALSLLQEEKAPAEYQQMVEQYIRNLSKGELPSR